MKNVYRIIASAAAALIVFGAVSCTKPVEPIPKFITITGITGDSTYISIVKELKPGVDPVATGIGVPEEDSIRFGLINKDPGEDDEIPAWTGSGSYVIILFIDGDTYVYTAGGEITAKLPTYNITDEETVISIEMFRKVEPPAE